MNFIYNSFKLKSKRKLLRKNQTDAERKVWSCVRNKQLMGLKFFRQYGVGNYILDFYCPEKRIAIEIDGGHHNEDNELMYDTKREEYLNSQAIHVIRFWNNDIMENMEGVMQKIVESL